MGSTYNQPPQAVALIVTFHRFGVLLDVLKLYSDADKEDTISNIVPLRSHSHDRENGKIRSLLPTLSVMIHDH